MRIKLKQILLPLLCVTAGCSKVPSYVIQPDEMAELMADIHIGESVIEVNRSTYYNDSLKQLLKQSIYEKHGVDQAKIDTSFYWYGHNITEYMAVYEKTIEILDRRISETGNRIKAEMVSIAGDSVDVWGGAQFLKINDRMPSPFLTFGLDKDDNMEKGDYYTWRAKFYNNPENTKWVIAVNYADKNIEYQMADVIGDGWKELSFYTDSSRQVEHIAGYLVASPKASSSIWVDSVMLVRNRFAPEKYSQRYRQKKLEADRD